MTAMTHVWSVLGPGVPHLSPPRVRSRCPSAVRKAPSGKPNTSPTLRGQPAADRAWSKKDSNRFARSRGRNWRKVQTGIRFTLEARGLEKNEKRKTGPEAAGGGSVLAGRQSRADTTRDRILRNNYGRLGRAVSPGRETTLK